MLRDSEELGLTGTVQAEPVVPAWSPALELRLAILLTDQPVNEVEIQILHSIEAAARLRLALPTADELTAIVRQRTNVPADVSRHAVHVILERLNEQ